MREEKEATKLRQQNVISDFKSDQQKENLTSSGKIKNTIKSTKSIPKSTKRLLSAKKLNFVGDGSK